MNQEIMTKLEEEYKRKMFEKILKENKENKEDNE